MVTVRPNSVNGLTVEDIECEFYGIKLGFRLTNTDRDEN